MAYMVDVASFAQHNQIKTNGFNQEPWSQISKVWMFNFVVQTLWCNIRRIAERQVSEPENITKAKLAISKTPKRKLDQNLVKYWKFHGHNCSSSRI